jgi:hypothetical protein
MLLNCRPDVTSPPGYIDATTHTTNGC